MAISDYAGITQALVALLLWFGVDFKALKRRMPLGARRNKVILILVAGSFIWSTYSLYNSAQADYLKSDWMGRDPRWKQFQKKEIVGRKFYHETVPIDGYRYVNCTFDGVTFLVNSTAPYEFSSTTVVNGPMHVKTDNARIGAFLVLLQHLQMLKDGTTFEWVP